MPAIPSLGLHANRIYSVPSNGSNGPKNCFSRSDFLTGRSPTAFASDQSMSICVNGESPSDPTTLPTNWPKAGRVLSVPKTVILSSLPFWTLMWESSYFIGPRDVIGEDLITGALGNYYYFAQWDNVQQDTMIVPDYNFAVNNSNYDGSEQATSQYAAQDPNYLNNQAWRNFDNNLTTELKNTVYNSRASCDVSNPSTDPVDCSMIPAYMINLCPTPPQERFSRIIAQVENPYYQQHNDLITAFKEVKKTLESDPVNPIYVIIPEWVPLNLVQLRNAFLTEQHETLNGAHGGAVNFAPCNVSDALPCYNYTPVCWAPPYPSVNDPRNQEAFQTPGTPFLASAVPGFGTDVLHLYIGHSCMKYFTSNSIWDFQAWPLTPEVQWIAGSVFEGSYLGDSQPFFAGSRAIWRDLGFDYGYTGEITAQSLYTSRYSGIVSSAATAYKQQFWDYRNFTTHLFTYQSNWEFAWSFNNIFHDQENTCPSTQFFFGFNTFSDFASFYDTIDNNITDCEDDAQNNPAKLKYGETHNNFPDTPSLQAAVSQFYPPIAARIENYYTTIETGTKQFYDVSIAENGLTPYNVVSKGTVRNDFFSSEGIIAYVRAYFAGQLAQYEQENPNHDS